nr:cobyric acid synthase [Spirochaeta isovalerica]
MIQGTGSDVGKSLIVAALCRIYNNRGLSVAPFKAQNMALNSFVTPDGLEIGRAQALQAAASRLETSVEMNPVLIKPHGFMKSQIVVMGKPWKDLEASDYYKTKERLWNHVRESLDSLTSRYDLVICEGAGSPAEINLKDSEIVNMAVAQYLNAPVLLAADIDRGGVFASLYGTVELLDADEKALIKGFLINKFRGDVSLLEPGLKMLEDLTGGRKTVGVIPWMADPGLAQEDSVFVEKNRRFGGGPVDIVVIQLPRMSNYDDFDALLLEKGVGIRLVDHPGEIGFPSAIIIPGSKTTAADLKWMRETGMERKIIDLAETGTPVTGICGGFQMLGLSISDPFGLEGDPGDTEGMKLLPVKTHFNREKKTVRVQGHPATDRGFLQNFNEPVTGYEIHMGESVLKEGAFPLFIKNTGEEDGAVSLDGRIWGTYFHGVFNEPGFRRRWLESIGWTVSGIPRSLNEVQEEHLDRLAGIIEENCQMDLIDRIIGL